MSFPWLHTGARLVSRWTNSTLLTLVQFSHCGTKMSLLITYYRLHNPGASTNSFPFCRAQLFTVPHLQFLWHSTLDPEALNIVQEVNLWIKGELMNKSIYFRNTPIYFTVSVFVSSCQTRKSNQKQWLSWCLNWLRAADGKPTFFASSRPLQSGGCGPAEVGKSR